MASDGHRPVISLKLVFAADAFTRWHPNLISSTGD